MTQALMAVYPDIFRAGSAKSGVPAGCWADGYDPSQQWSNTCAAGSVSKTAQQWGDLVRAMYLSYTGHRPRVQLFHGTADITISYNNMAESIKEWTDVLSLNSTPTSTDAYGNYTRQFWNNTCGYRVLEAWAAQGVGHSMAFDEADILKFFGLDTAGGPDPEPACSGDAGAGGSTGSGGTTGTGGITGSGGRPGTGGITGSGGTTDTGGVSGSGGTVGSGGVTGTGGVLSSGGADASISTGGTPGLGGIKGSGGSGGLRSTDGGSGMGGAPGTSGAAGSVSGNGGIVIDANVATGGIGGNLADAPVADSVAADGATYTSVNDSGPVDVHENADGSSASDGLRLDAPPVAIDSGVSNPPTASVPVKRHGLYDVPSCSFGHGARNQIGIFLLLALWLLRRVRR